MPTWRDPDVPVLIAEPASAVVSDEAVCLGCHDGAMGDARVKVWDRDGHEAGRVVPEGMKVPEDYPLVDGKMACRTCHTAHTVPEAVSAEDAISLRAPVTNSALCLNCHGERAAGAEHGSHPVGEMPYAVPAVLKAHGALAGDDDKRLHCQTCHAPHGTTNEHQLVMPVHDNALCVTCHTDQRSGRWAEGATPELPQLDDSAQRAAIHILGTRVGSEDRLVCLSCHRMHPVEGHEVASKFLLARPLSDGAMCLSCHLDKQSLLVSVHDLRRTAPHLPNLHGQRPHESGPCGTCHLFHDLAVEVTGDRADPGNICRHCHEGSGVGTATGSIAHGHPMRVSMTAKPVGLKLPLLQHGAPPRSAGLVTCTTCHDPHLAPGNWFLRADSPTELCVACHGDVQRALEAR